MILPKFISVTDYNDSSVFKIKYKMESNIPKVDYRFLDREIGWQYNPVTISQYALCLYDESEKDSDQSKKELFLKQINWLEKNLIVLDNEHYTYYYHFPNKWYDLSSPWVSGMAQGQTASVFLRAFLLTQNEKYLHIAEKLLNFMLLKKDSGGTLIRTPEGGFWIEEYVSPKPSMVLNGHLYGLIGLCEYNKIQKNDHFIDLANKLIQTTIDSVNLYEKDNWLIYAREYNTNKCDYKYMGLQVLEAKHLYFLTKRPEFNEIYERWNNFIDWKKFWKDVERQNTKFHYMIKNIKGYIKSILFKGKK
jgi:hypothetical protein